MLKILEIECTRLKIGFSDGINLGVVYKCACNLEESKQVIRLRPRENFG